MRAFKNFTLTALSLSSLVNWDAYRSVRDSQLRDILALLEGTHYWIRAEQSQVIIRFALRRVELTNRIDSWSDWPGIEFLKGNLSCSTSLLLRSGTWTERSHLQAIDCAHKGIRGHWEKSIHRAVIDLILWQFEITFWRLKVIIVSKGVVRVIIYGFALRRKNILAWNLRLGQFTSLFCDQLESVHQRWWLSVQNWLWLFLRNFLTWLRIENQWLFRVIGFSETFLNRGRLS